MEVCNQTSSWGHDLITTSDDEISRRCSNHKKEVGSSCSLPLDSTTHMPTEDGADHEYATYGDDDDDVDGNEDSKNMQQHELMQVVCSMCGHVGLPQCLFKCLSCSCRFQHFYCSKLYPYRMEAAICNWCLPLKLEITAAEEDDDDYLCKSIDNSNATCYLPINPGRSQSYQQVKQIKKHSKAFEYLLQIIAELADDHHHERCHEAYSIHQTKSTNKTDTDVGHDQPDIQTGKVCRFNEVGYNYKNSEVDKSDVHHVSLLQQNNSIREVFERKSFSTRTEEAQSQKGASSAMISKRPPSWHNDTAWQPAQATDGGEYYQTMEGQSKSYNVKAGYLRHDLLLRNKRLTDYYEAISLPGGTAAVAKRQRSIKKCESLMGGAESDDCIDGEKANEQGSILAAAAKMGFDDLDYLSAAAVAVIDDDVGDENGALKSKQMMCVAAMQKPAAGKRDHLINSPSRAFNRRYKLLADVLC